MSDKTIFIYINQGFSARYLLRTDVYKNLVNSDQKYKIVILSHNGDEKTFKDEFKNENVFVEKFQNEKCSKYLQKNKLQRGLILLRSFILNGKYETKTIDDFRKIFLYEKKWSFKNGLIDGFKGFIWKLIINLFQLSKMLRKSLIYFESKFFSPSFHNDLFKKYSPDYVITTALCGFNFNEIFAREAKKNKVPVCCVILSWDNTTGMGMRGYEPDHVISWTEAMKEELIRLNDIDSNKISVGGVAHFDAYYNSNLNLSKKSFFKKMDLDENKKTIFYATKSPKRFPWGPELVMKIAKAIKSNKISENSQVLVRIHPLHYRRKNGEYIFKNILDQYDEISKKYSFVKINSPATINSKMDFNLPDSETQLVISILKFSDVMLNMFSTMVIESAIFDLPSINLCIQELCKADYGNSKQDIMVDYYQTHNQRVIKTGGVKTVFTMKGLYKSINTYLNNPEIDKEKRKVIIKNEAGPYPGNSGYNIYNQIISLLK